MKNFNGCTVHCKNDSWEINGKKVVETREWLACGNPNSTLYEVKLDNGKFYQLYEDEMIYEE